MKILGIIPARGGSKRVPGKNIEPVCGKPLIAWAIENTKTSALDRVIISTDSEEIAAIAKKHGGDVPFIRPETFANDTAAIEPVLKHAYEWMRDNQGFKADTIALLFATNPMRTKEHIEEAVEIFKKTGADSVVSVIEARGNMNPAWILKRDSSGAVMLHNGKPLTEIPTRSQDLPVEYSRNDILYLLKPENLYEKIPNLYGKKVELIVMGEDTVADINTPEDRFVTEQKMKFRGFC